MIYIEYITRDTFTATTYCSQKHSAVAAIMNKLLNDARLWNIGCAAVESPIGFND